MKKLLIIVIVIFLTIPCAFSEDVDLSGLTFGELMQLQTMISAEIISRPEWKEVNVPSGSWTVGKEIPAGTYSLMPGKNGGGYIKISRNGRTVIAQGIRENEDAFGKIELQEGDIISIERGSIIFAPPITLGF